MRQSFFKGHLEISFYNLPTWPVQVTVGKSMGGIVADRRLPLASCEDLKLHGKPHNPSAGDLVVDTNS